MYPHHFIIALLLFFTHLFQVALGEYCGDNLFCHPPYRCCQIKNGCCYDSLLHTHKRLQIWNMWYFWFLIIFMMMSCFGGCGYYRRRRLAMLSQANQSNNRPAIILTASQRSNRVRAHRNRALDVFTYNCPGAALPLPVANLPPAYSEVVCQPGLYPVNKCELPPYPGDKTDNDAAGMAVSSLGAQPGGNEETCLPPPYSEYPPEESGPPLTQEVAGAGLSTGLATNSPRQPDSGTNS